MKNKQLRTFGRVKGHKLSKLQNDLIKDFLPTIRPDLSKISSKIWFEIGFGAGEHLIQLISERHDRDITIIGCEPYINGAIKPIKYIYEKDCKNVFIHDSDARELIEKLPTDSVEKFFILFPDPWPKKRHNKRRIISQRLIELLLDKVSDNGEIIIATDHLSYCELILEILSSYKFEYIKLNSEEACSNSGILTRYCQKALARMDEINMFIVTK